MGPGRAWEPERARGLVSVHAGTRVLLRMVAVADPLALRWSIANRKPQVARQKASTATRRIPRALLMGRLCDPPVPPGCVRRDRSPGSILRTASRECQTFPATTGINSTPARRTETLSMLRFRSRSSCVSDSVRRTTLLVRPLIVCDLRITLAVTAAGDLASTAGA